MSMRQRLFSIAAFVLLLPALGFAQTYYPVVRSLYPAGGQQGKTVDVTVRGSYLNDAIGVLWEGGGLKGEVIQSDSGSAKVRITISPEAKLGPYEFRLVTKHGASSVALFYVGDEPEVMEVDDNNTPDKAQSVSLPSVINGRIDRGEDVDLFKFSAQAGEQIVLSIICRQMLDKNRSVLNGFAPTPGVVLDLLDAKGRELSPTFRKNFKGDPTEVYTLNQGGDYLVRVRDISYNGNADWVYRLTVTKRPFVLAAFPVAVRRASSVDMELAGFNLNGTKSVKIDIPSDAPLGIQTLQLQLNGSRSNPVPLIVTEHPVTVENEPNNSIEQATPLKVPCSASGRLASNDVDCFAFRAKKGEVFVFEVEANRLGSSVDSFLQLLDSKGNVIATGDDVSIDGRLLLDSRLEWTAPDEADYFIQVRDLNYKGGDDYVYHLSVQPLKPDFRLRAYPDKINVASGCSAALYVQVQRIAGFDGEVQLELKGLPEGVTATQTVIPAHANHAILIVTAAPEAPRLWNGFVQIVGVGSRKNQDGSVEIISRTATSMGEVWRAFFPVNHFALAITDAPDIVLEVDKQEITLSPGEEVTINVTVKRHERYKDRVLLGPRMLYWGDMTHMGLPPGVSVDEGKSKALVAPNETQGKLTLKVAENASALRDWILPIVGVCALDYDSKMNYCAPPIKLTIKPKAN